MNFNSNTSTPIDRCELRRKIQILSVAFREGDWTRHFKIVGTFDRRAPGIAPDGCRRQCCVHHGLGLLQMAVYRQFNGSSSRRAAAC